LADAYPHQVTVPRDDNFGLAVLSRWPLADTNESALGPGTLPAILTRLHLSGGSLTLLTGHPPAPRDASRFALRDDTIRALGSLAQGQVGPVLLCADLNTGPWSPTFADLLAASGLVDTRRGQGVLPTWGARWPHGSVIPYVPAIPIDHCLVSPEIGVDEVRVGPNLGSDHLPLIVDLELPAR
jgi:endonuclease/exonuclease/phosphatase (EEP) superfamily protein YafD